MRSTKLTVMNSMLCLSCDSSTSSTTKASDRTPAMAGRRTSTRKKVFRMPQARAKASRDAGSLSVSSMMANAAMCDAAISTARSAA